MELSNEENYINFVNLRSNSNFPYLVLEIINGHSYPRNAGFKVAHWHEDLQFIYLEQGNIEIKTLNDTVHLSEGDCIFINKNVVHQVVQLGKVHYYSFIFPEKFLFFYEDSPTKKIVQQITENSSLQTFTLKSEKIEYRQSLNILQELVLLEKNKTEMYLYQVLVLLTQLWLEIQTHISISLRETESFTQKRMKIFLIYIDKHFSEDISLEDIAKSANVSKTECLRCFRQSMQNTPYQYLMEYRLSKGANLLINSEETIEVIANAVGFHQSSYFGKCFKEKTGYSPKQYRSIQKSDYKK